MVARRGRTVEAVEHDLSIKVAFLRGRGVAWSEIAGALQVSEEEAVSRFEAR